MKTRYVFLLIISAAAAAAFLPGGAHDRVSDLLLALQQLLDALFKGVLDHDAVDVDRFGLADAVGPVGGLILGFVEIMSVAFFPTLSGYKDAFAFVLLIVILLVKPTGLMGEKMEEKI